MLRLYIDRRIGKANTATDVRADVLSAHLMERPRPAPDGDRRTSGTENSRNGQLIVENWQDEQLEAYMRRNNLTVLAYPYEVVETLAGGELRRRRSEKRLVVSSLPAALQTAFTQRVKMPIVDAGAVTLNTLARPAPARGGTVEGRDDQRRAQPRQPRRREVNRRRLRRPAPVVDLRDIPGQLARAGSNAARKQIKGSIAQSVLDAAARRRHSFATYEFEVLQANSRRDGVEVWVRAWEAGNPVGFGGDGTVEIERLVIINPPLGVREQDGSVTIAPRAALMRAIGQTIKTIAKDGANIIGGKVGQSSYTVYSDAGGDGQIAHSNATWATVRTDTTGSSTNNDAASFTVIASNASPYQIFRGLLPFDTSSVPNDETFDRATLSLSVLSVPSNDDTASAVLLEGAQAAVDSLATTDYPWNSATHLGSDILLSALSGTATWSVPEASLSLGSGFTSLMLVLDIDVDDSAPTGNNQCSFFSADQTGTSNDPNLVVELSGAASVSIRPAGGGDYADFATAEADLGSGARTWTVYEGGDCGSVTLNDVDPTSLAITVAALNQHDGISGGAFTSGTITVQSAFGAKAALTITGLRFSGANIIIASNVEGFSATLDKCLGTSGGMSLSNTTITTTWDLVVRNSIIPGVIVTNINGTNSYTFQNCTFWRDSAALATCRFFRSGGTPTILFENCYAHNLDSAEAFLNFSGTAGSVTLNNCASHDATADDFSGSNNLINKSAASQFVAFGSGDYRLRSGCALADAGKTIGAVTDDIIATARPVAAAYDIGAFEGTISVAMLTARSPAHGGAYKTARKTTDQTD